MVPKEFTENGKSRDTRPGYALPSVNRIGLVRFVCSAAPLFCSVTPFLRTETKPLYGKRLEIPRIPRVPAEALAKAGFQPPSPIL